MKVYHGTSWNSACNILEKGILLSKSKEYTDFYRGFYVSEHYEYAEQTALHKAKISKNSGRAFTPAVVELEFDEGMTNTLNVLDFPEENLDWLQFIINNRNGVAYVNGLNTCFHNIGLNYDIVKGRVCDGSIIVLAEQLRSCGKPAQLCDLKNVIYNNNPYASQISFHTPKALKTISAIIAKEVR